MRGAIIIGHLVSIICVHRLLQTHQALADVAVDTVNMMFLYRRLVFSIRIRLTIIIVFNLMTVSCVPLSLWRRRRHELRGGYALVPRLVLWLVLQLLLVVHIAIVSRLLVRVLGVSVIAAPRHGGGVNIIDRLGVVGQKLISERRVHLLGHPLSAIVIVVTKSHLIATFLHW